MSVFFVTGGAGFIGSHLCSILRDEGHQTVAYDAMQTYIPTVRQRSTRDALAYRFDELLRGTEVVRGDTSDQSSLRRALQRVEPDYVIHLAGMPLANVSMVDSEGAYRSIVHGTLNLLEAIKDSKPLKKLTYISSSMAYGNFEHEPIEEGAHAAPIDIYGAMKLAGEVVVQGYARAYQLPVTVVRPSAVYGPGDINRRVVQIFVENALNGDPIVANDPESTWLDFTYVRDTARGIKLATESEFARDEVLNITFGGARSLVDLLTIIQQHVPGLTWEAVHRESWRPRRGTLDVSKAERLAGYVPEFPLERGLGEYVGHLRSVDMVPA